MGKLIPRFGIVLQILFVVIVVSIIYQWKTNLSNSWPDGFSQPTVALELASSVTTAHQTLQLLGPQGVKRQHQALIADSIAFIPLYWVVLSSLGAILTYRRIRFAGSAGILVIVLVTAAAIFDYRENSGIAKILGAYPNDPSFALVEATRTASLTKWSLIFAASAVSSLLFLPRADWIGLVGVYQFVVAAMGLIGVISRHTIIELATALMTINLLLIGMSFSSKRYYRDFYWSYAS